MAEYKHSSVPAGFKEIPGYDGRYFINEKGEVWSTFRNRVLTQHLDAQKRYLQSLMMVPGRTKGIPRYIHKLVVITWIGEAPGPVGTKRGYYCINHKDGNKLNNHASNLEWVTNEENLSHAWRTGLRNDFIGENAKNSVFTSEDVRNIRLRILDGEKVKDVAREYNVNVGVIKNIQKFYSWKRQDWDLIGPMMQICRSKWLAETLKCTKTGNFYSYSDLCRYTSKAESV